MSALTARTPTRSAGASDADLLFDAPGPKGRRRILIGSVLVTLIILALAAAALMQLDQAGQLAYPKWRYFLGQSVVGYLGRALADTLLVTAVGAALSFPLGVGLGWVRTSRHASVRMVVGAWIDAMRAIPMLLLIYFFLLAVPRWGLTLPPFWMLTVPIVMCSSATTAEVFRAGVLALDRGQTEASQVLGLSAGQTMRLILAPQALRLMLPTLITQLVTILKDSSLGYVVAYLELMYAGRLLTSSARVTAHLDVYLPAYVIIAVIYVVINWALGALARRVEARTR
ncbi:amino acid ABC transporter permease [Actinomyces ruminicola]|uniref:Glutamate transport system permease protein n=1 Tax=Actinomyces ruminicola TaxID=332524 RepID=A0A1G9TJB5_9ACTO|nr:amino acid ABC transporter permease [Actinomyces ruminicola]SDM47879.1 glutamate transport system permease protein [Actinomyces ruminicola]